MLEASGRDQRSAAPVEALLAADAGSFAVLGGQEVGVRGVAIAPGQKEVQSAGPNGVVGVVRVGQVELP